MSPRAKPCPLLQRRAVALVALLLMPLASLPAAAGDLAPDWSLPLVGGGVVDFHADARGAPSVLLFWASWCPHCGRVLPYVQALYREFAPRGARFYALDIWEDGDAVAYFRERGYDLPLYLAADLVAEDYGIDGTPGVVVVDEGLRVVDLGLDGLPPARMAAALRDYLERRLAKRAVQADGRPPASGTH